MSAGSNPAMPPPPLGNLGSVRFWERNGSGQARACAARCGQLDRAQCSDQRTRPSSGLLFERLRGSGRRGREFKSPHPDRESAGHGAYCDLPFALHAPGCPVLGEALDPGTIVRRRSSRAVSMAAAGIYQDLRPLRFHLASTRVGKAVVAQQIGLQVLGQVRGVCRAGRGRRSGQS
jgi:hypothetical protein